MRRACCAPADHLLTDRQIQTHDSVFVEPDTPQVKGPRDHGGQRSVQESSSSLCILAIERLPLLDPYGNVKGFVLWTHRAKILDQELLLAADLWVCAMTNKGS